MNNQKNRRIFLSWNTALLIVLATAIVPLAHSAQVMSIRHGIHADFERVVFDIIGMTEYQVDSVSLNGKLQVTMQGIQTQHSLLLDVSPNAKLVLGIGQTTPGHFEISTLSPVKAHSYAISGDTYRIVVDLHPRTAETVSKPQIQKPSSLVKQTTHTTPESDEPLAQKKINQHQDNQNSENDDEPIYDFNGLYKLKQSAIRCQTEGKLDSAGLFWVEYIAAARKLKVNLTGNSEFDPASWNEGNIVVTDERDSAIIYSNTLLIIVAVASVIAIVLILIRRQLQLFLKPLFRKKWENLVEDDQPEEEPDIKEKTPPKPEKRELAEEKTEEKPQEEKVEDEPIEDEVTEEPKAQKPVPEENNDDPPEQTIEKEEVSEEIEEASPDDDEDTALEELMNFGDEETEAKTDDEPSEKDEKVQRILELAEEERSIAEIAEEMGIGEDEVRLVLDLQ
jgi:hypothetical protein